MRTREIPVNNRSQININLTDSIDLWKDTVAVGYGNQQTGKLPVPVSRINRTPLQRQPVANVSRALQEIAAGIHVAHSNTPGSNAKILMHGFSTINNNDPLWVIDGVPYRDGLEALNPNEIESISILKDAASTAIYGIRGAMEPF